MFLRYPRLMIVEELSVSPKNWQKKNQTKQKVNTSPPRPGRGGRGQRKQKKEEKSREPLSPTIVATETKLFNVPGWDFVIRN